MRVSVASGPVRNAGKYRLIAMYPSVGVMIALDLDECNSINGEWQWRSPG